MGSAPRSIACFGKPLVARELSRRAQMELLYRHALLVHGRDPGLAAPPSQVRQFTAITAFIDYLLPWGLSQGFAGLPNTGTALP